MEPTWVQVAIQLLTLLIAGGIAWGVVKTKLADIEKEITANTARVAAIERDFTAWQKLRSKDVVTVADCARIQTGCQQAVLQKLEGLKNDFSDYRRVAETNWRNIASTVGVVCTKLEVKPPEWK